MTLAANGLSVCRGGLVALSEVTASFAAGSLSIICGPNGAGKSTLLGALAGLVAPSSGTVLLDDYALAAMPAQERARTIGYLPQHAQVAWDVDVQTLVGLGRLPWRGSAEADRTAVAEALAATDLTDLAGRPVSRLSGGERARALLGRVLAGRPRWILADEPLAALDLSHQATLLDRLRRLADGGCGVVMVVHDLAVAMNVADRVLVLDGGALAAAGPPEEALGEETIARIWGLPVRWLGQPGERALLVV